MKIRPLIFRGYFSIVLVALLSASLVGQCVEHPDHRTVVKFNNESSYDLTFFIDNVETETVLSRSVGSEWSVDPGSHILRAQATLGSFRFIVLAFNEIPEGNLCTWTIEDPPK